MEEGEGTEEEALGTDAGPTVGVGADLPGTTETTAENTGAALVPARPGALTLAAAPLYTPGAGPDLTVPKGGITEGVTRTACYNTLQHTVSVGPCVLQWSQFPDIEL